MTVKQERAGIGNAKTARSLAIVNGGTPGNLEISDGTGVIFPS
jgi:hypothetical protein